VPVYVDGDAPNAQKEGRALQGERVSDDGAVQRLRGGDHAAARRSRSRTGYMQVLTEGMNGARPVKATLAAALGAGRRRAKLAAGDWRKCSAYYS
jgi:hypothetical protein